MLTVSRSVSSSGWAARISSARSWGSARLRPAASSGPSSGGMANASRRSRSVPDVLALSVIDGGVLRGWRAAELQHARVIAGVGVDPLAHGQAHAPVVAEVEHVADPLPNAEPELGDRDVRCRHLRIGHVGGCELGLVGAEEA